MSERGVNTLATAVVGLVLMIAMLALVLLTDTEPAEAPTGPDVQYGVTAV